MLIKVEQLELHNLIMVRRQNDLTITCLILSFNLYSFVSALQHKAVVKSSSSFRKNICPLLFDNVKREVDKILFSDLPTCDGVAFTTDHWTSRAYDSYQALTLHYITKDFKLMKVKPIYVN